MDLLCFGLSAVIVESKLKLGVGIVLRSSVTSQDGTILVSVYFRLAQQTIQNRASPSNRSIEIHYIPYNITFPYRFTTYF